MVDTNTAVHASTARKSPAVGNRPVAPWIPSDSGPPPKVDVGRRYSAATIRAEKSPAFDDLPENPPLPNTMDDKKSSKMKKSETFYSRFVKNVLSTSRRQSKDVR